MTDEQPTTDEVTLYAEFTARRGRAREVESLIGTYAARVRSEPGTVLFDVYRRAEAPDRFVVLEVYRDRESFDAHLGAEAGRAFNEALLPLIVEPGSRLSFLHPAARA